MADHVETTQNTSLPEKSMSQRRTFVSITILIIVLVLLLWYLNPDTVVAALTQVSSNPFPILLFFTFFLMAFIFRSIRWHLILGSTTSVRTLFRISLVTWFVNAITPARLGDVTSIYLFHSEEEIPAAKGILLVMIDRIMDVLSLLILFVLLLNVVIQSSVLGDVALFFLIFSIVIVLAAFFVLLLLINNPTELQSLVEKTIGRMSSKLTARLVSGIQESNEELAKLVREKRRLLLAFLLAFPTWLLESTSTFLVARALNVDLDMAVAFVAVMVGFFSMTVPLTIGGFGGFEVAIATVLVLLHSLDDKTALLIAFLDHIFRQLFVLGAGFIALWTFRHRIDEFLGKMLMKK